jgi:putative DNA primase/helicase
MRPEAGPGNGAAPGGFCGSEERQEPKPLQRDIPPGTPFPFDALGDLLGPATRKMRAVIQAPAAICGNSLLAAADLAVQAHADVVIDGRVFPISEMFETVGQTGERKSEADKVALRPHREYERTLAEKYGQDLLAYQRDHDAYEKTKQEALGSKQKSYEAKRRALSELGEAPVGPLEPLFLCEEPTYEGLVKLLAIGQPSVGLFSDEGGRFIGGHGMNPDNLLKTAAGLSGLWDGKPIDRVRGGDGCTKLYGRRVSLHLMVQPEVSQLMLSNPVLIGQGLLSRCLVTWPESTAGTRPYCEEDLSASKEIADYNALMKRILETPLPLADGVRNELAPRHLAPAPDAKKLWVRFHDHVERQLVEGGALASIRGLGNKAPEHAARLAGVLALVRDIHVSHIALYPMEAGIELITYYLNEALRLYEVGVQDPQLCLAQKLLGWLKARGQTVVTLPEIYQLGPKPIRNARVARLLMGILEEHGYVKAIDERTEYRGTPRCEAWGIWP